MNIIHLSQTDIRTDSRILKEINSLSKSIKGINIIGIGVNNETELLNLNIFN